MLTSFLSINLSNHSIKSGKFPHPILVQFQRETHKMIITVHFINKEKRLEMKTSKGNQERTPFLLILSLPAPFFSYRDIETIALKKKKIITIHRNFREKGNIYVSERKPIKPTISSAEPTCSAR